MLCVNSYYIDQRMAEIDREETRIDAINNRIAELIKKGADYYPFTRENIMEALGGLNDSQELILQHSLESGLNEIGLMLGNWIEQYWTLQAEEKAIKELSDDFPH